MLHLHVTVIIVNRISKADHQFKIVSEEVAWCCY